jgi:shikimate dehydrogenase
VGAPLLVNATPLGQAGDPEALPLEPALLPAGALVCDLAYRGDGTPTPLIAAARRAGTRAVDGIDVLVAQGVHAFRLFTGLEPPVEVMRSAARG